MNRTFLDRRFVCSAVIFLSAMTASAQTTRLETSAQTTAGGTASSVSFNMTATVGQPSPAGEASAGQFTLSSGFVYTFDAGTVVTSPAAITNAASNVTTVSATLNATVNPNNASTSVKFQYGTTVSYGMEMNATPNPITGASAMTVTANLTGLVPNTFYHFRIVAENSAGTSNGDDQTFTTTAGLATVTTEAATNIGATSTILNGTVNPNNTMTAVKFQFGVTTSYGSEIDATPSSVSGSSITPVNAALTGLTPNTLYHYRIVATNTAGPSNGPDQTFTTSLIAPATTTSAATNVTTISATLNATVNPNNASTTVKFQYGTTTSYGSEMNATPNPIAGASAITVTTNLTGLVPNTLYHFRIVAANSAGTSNGDDQTFTTTAGLATVTTEAATNIGATSATFNGTVNPNNTMTAVKFQFGVTTSYGSEINATPSSVSGSSITPVNAALTELTPNTLYHYRIVATNTAGPSNGPDQTFTTSLIAPATTTSAATNVTTISATLNATVNPNNASTTVKFQYGTTTSYGSEMNATPNPIAGASAVTVTANLTGLVSNTLYHFRIVAANSAGTSNGNDQTFTTTAGLATVTTEDATNIGATAATLNGSVNPNNSNATIKFEYGPTTSYGSEIDATPSTASGANTVKVSAALSGLTPNTLYHYRIVAMNSAGTTRGPDQTFTTLTVVTAPTATTAAAMSVGATSATLNATVNPNNASTTVKFQYGATTSYGSEVTAAPSPVSGMSAVSVSAMIMGLTTNTLYHYRVVATNSAGTTNGVDVTFTTSNQSPSISHSPIVEPQAIGPINIQADITDDRANITVQLQYRRSGDLTSTPIAMSSVSGNTYRATIPSAVVSSRGVDYAILATDADNAQTRAPVEVKKFFSIPISIVSETKPSAQPGGTAANAYRLISAPFQLADASALAVLQDDLGSYNNTVWRLFGLDAGQPLTNKSPYVEVSQNGTFTPGKSFFLIVNESKTVDAGPGQSIRTDQEYSITLLPGHNFVASPFNFSIPLSKLRLQSNSAFSLQTFNGTWTPITDVISPWEGYYLPNNGGNDVLLVNPNLTAGAQPRAGDTGWRLQISAICGEARDLYNFAGVAPASADNWDDHDVPEPPPIGDFVSVYFPHPEWQKLFQRYTNDVQSATSANHRWNFSVETSVANQTVSLKFDGLNEVAPELSVFLVDVELNYKQNLRENTAYQYQPREVERPKEFSLFIGKEDFVAAQTASVQGVPENFVLEQNFPNPFGVGGAYLLQSEAKTMIRFGLPEKSVVTIKIFDLAGREVAKLLEKVEMPPGLHQRVWDGRDARGRLVPNGIYFYRLTAGSEVRTMKMMVIR